MGKKKTISEQNRELMGRKVLYVGNGVARKCANCEAPRTKAMMSEYLGDLYCSEQCVVVKNT